MSHITISYSDCDQLAESLSDTTGEQPELHAYRVHRSLRSECLSYTGSNPAIVVFELAVMLAARASRAAYRAGYEFGAVDAVDELRNVIRQIDSPCTKAIGSQIMYYWPTVRMVPS